MTIGLHPRGSKRSTHVALCCGLGVVLPKRHMALGLPAARIQFYFGSCPTRPEACLEPLLVSGQAKAPPSAWANRPKVGTLVPRVPGWFFPSNSSFLKFINDDNNIYAFINFNENTKIFIIQIIIFLVAII